MKNLVGDATPDTKTLTEQSKALHDLVEAFKVFCIVLSVDDRKSLARPRRGGEEKVEHVIQLAREFGVTIRDIPLEGIENDLRTARELRPIQALAESFAQMLTDTVDEARSEFWTSAMAYYGALSAMGSRVPELAERLSPMTEFMSNRKARKEATPAAPATPPVPTPPSPVAPVR
jgi:hypothetical protein